MTADPLGPRSFIPLRAEPRILVADNHTAVEVNLDGDLYLIESVAVNVDDLASYCGKTTVAHMIVSRVTDES